MSDTPRRLTPRLSRAASPASTSQLAANSLPGDHNSPNDIEMADAPRVSDDESVPTASASVPAVVAPNSQASPDLCSICLQDLEKRAGRALLNPGCGHELHLTCFNTLLRNNPAATCPSCRKPLGAGLNSQGMATPLPTINAIPPANWSRNISSIFNFGQNRQAPQLQRTHTGGATGYGSPSHGTRDFFRNLPSEYNPADDDAIEVSTSTATRSTTTLYDYSSMVTLKLDSETDPVTNEATKVTAMLSMNIGEDPNETEDRNAIDMVLVVDKSGSMSGSKITQVKDTLRYILEVSSLL
jgi:hypothetical protein